MRYYKATDGQITVFRQTNRVYRSASFKTQQADPSGRVFMEPWTLRFSGAESHGSLICYPAVEISRQEYRQLQQLKVARCKVDVVRGDAPVNSWVRNADIPTSLAASLRILLDGDPVAPATSRGWDTVET